MAVPDLQLLMRPCLAVAPAALSCGFLEKSSERQLSCASNLQIWLIK